MKVVRLLLLMILVVHMRNSTAQYSASIYDSIVSQVLAEQRKIEILLPAGYNTDQERYDVWYVPDGEWNTRTFSVIADYLHAIGFAPHVIVVGVHNRYSAGGFNYRDRDFTPIKGAEMDSSGGAEKFLTFFEKELMPYVAAKYRASGECGIFGSSLGGVFAFYALLQRPHLFRYYSLADPAFQFGGQYINQIAAERLPQLKIQDRALNIGGRNGISYQLMGRDVMDSLLRKNATQNLHWHSAVYDDETHISSVFKSNYDGLKFAYLGYSAMNSAVNLTGGIIMKEKPVTLFMPTDHTDIRYTTDGSPPTRQSEKFEENIVVADPDRLRIKSFSAGGMYDRKINISLRTGNFLTPLTLSAQGRASRIIQSRRKHNNAGKIDSILSAPVDGYYVFQLLQGIKFTLNDSLIVNMQPNTGLGMHQREMIMLPLRKGKYPIHLESVSKNPVELFVYYSEDGQSNWKILE